MAFSRRTLIESYAYAIIFIYAFMCSTSTTTTTHAWSPIRTQNQEQFYNYVATAQPAKTVTQNNEILPYVDLVLCPVREEPWSCARQQSGRILDVWENGLYKQWQKFKVEADRELNATLEKRGYSGSDIITKEKPSTILKKIEIGTNYLKEYVTKNINGFWNHESAIAQHNKDGYDIEKKEQHEHEKDDDDDEEQKEKEEEEEEYEDEKDPKNKHVNAKNDAIATNEGEVEFFEINEAEQGIDDGKVDDDNVDDDIDDEDDVEINGQLKRPGGGGKRKKNKNKRKKGQQNDGGVQVQPATVLLLQQPAVVEQQHHHGGAGTEEVHVSSVHDDGGKPNKFKRRKDKRQKRKKNKHQQQQEYEHELEYSDDDLLASLLDGHGGSGGLELLDNLSMEDWLVGGGKRKKGYPSKYGRSNGVTRGKKKKKKKALMKLVLLGSFLKAKIELLLKILGAHLQIKFFAIALIGLLINIARFWIDVKRGGAPQKVVYVEHAHHQHHYEDHGEDWNEPGGYWKRSLHTDTTPEGGSATDSYLPQDDAHLLAYRNSNPQWQ